MERLVVVSTNNNPDYFGYSKYIKHAWNKLGWKVAVMITHDVDQFSVEGDYVIQLPVISSLRTESIAQAGRLYAANYLPKNSLIMTSDMDLLPLSDYWHPKENEITNYGHDLTDYSFYPMGYTCMNWENWKKVMNLSYNTEADMIRDANDPKLKYSPLSNDWEQWWNWDWDLLTKRLEGYEVTKVLRGRRPGSCFALGRVDRGDSMVIPNEPLIDAHLENHNIKHPEKWSKFISLFEKHYGKLS
jgi:hypothetical protein